MIARAAGTGWPGRAGRRTAALLLFVSVLARPVSAAVADFIGKPVGAVRFFLEGRETTDPAFVSIVETTAGAPLSMVQVRESIAHLFSLGRFDDVRVDASLENARVTLRYELSPIHPVTDIRFAGRTGAAGIDIGALRRVVADRYGATPPIGRTSDMVRLLSDALAADGYLHPSVSSAVRLDHAPERATLTFTLEPGARTTIGTIDITGAPSLPRSELLRRINLVQGAPFRRERLASGLERYIQDRRKRGYYEAKITPSIQLADQDRVANVTLAVDPGPHVRVVFTGDPLPGDRRNELVPVEREGSVDEDLLEDSTNRIEDYLRYLGYREAKAPHTREQRDAELVITFAVRRGPQYRVAKLEIAGNTNIASSEFEMALKLREGQPFSDGRVADDAALVEDLYHRRGYASAKVQPTTGLRPTGNTAAQVPVMVRFDVFEGERIVVDSITFTGNTSFDDAALRGKMALQVGAPYVPGQLRQDRDQVQAVYNDRGYESATVDARPEFNPQNTRASIVFTIREGPRVFVDHVLIVGNVRTDAGTIERELQIKPGDPFSLSSISESQRRLMALGLFRRARIGELRHGNETARDLLVTVEEAAATTIGYGVGGEGRLLPVPQEEAGGAAAARFQVLPRAFLEYGRRNLFGKPRSVNVFSSVSVPLNLNQTQTSGRLTEYRLLGTYREPRLFDTATDGLLNATIEQQIRSSFTFRREGITAQAARRLTRGLSMSVAYQIQRNELLAVNVAEPDVLLINRLFSPEPVRLSGFSASIIRDTRDDAVNPGSGQYLTANGQVDAVAIGSQVGFAKSFLRAQTFHTLPRSNGAILAGNAILGMAGEFNTEKPIPEPERFFAGGDTTNRGFALDTLGVRHEPSETQRDTIDKNGFPIGGDATVVLMGELRVPVRGGLSVVGFLDSGNVFQRVSQVDLTELRGAVGFGVRYRSPFGPLRVDLGFKTHVAEFLCPTSDDPAKRCPESRPALHISFGQAF
ncbi:MAG: hypothetical protein DMG02_10070 [Acidobacteria bacterium]|nr:MAG: hypothetical protein DMG02_10070 [Acidobacteriota bacterium]PYR11628.1 MAG: hypothetical protein DMF99_07085 [Acidobacteriota bacterium]